MRLNHRTGADVIGSFIDAVTWDQAIRMISEAAVSRVSSHVCICNTHSLIEAGRNVGFRDSMRSAMLCTPDGAPVAWMLRRLGYASQDRINGPDLMWRYFSHLNESSGGPSVFLYGGSPETLERLGRVVKENFPLVSIAGVYSPPYRALSQDEKDDVVAMINASGAGSVWVGLGCPKQELWMLENNGKVHGVMVGVGAAFDYHAGVIKRAPMWMQHSGLEWLHRLSSEPRRLWRRYLYTNSLFIILAGWQVLRRWLFRLS